MSLQLYWFLPSHGDGRTISRRRRVGAVGARAMQRPPDLTYLRQVCGAVEQGGFAGMLVPAGMFCEDPWVLSAALAQTSATARFMVAFRPGLLSPLLAAQMAATTQRATANRLLLNVVTGGDAKELARYGDALDHDARYERSAEFLALLRRLWSGEPVTYAGRHVQVTEAQLTRPPAVPPPVFVGGSSAAARRVAAEHGDVYLAWGETPAELVAMFDQTTALAGGFGREVACGTRFHVICRDTAEEAWAIADELVAELPSDLVRSAQARAARSDSVGQRRMADLAAGGLSRLEVHPNIWAGYGLLRPGAGAALVGSHSEVADRIAELYAAGVRHLILSGQPHLEEAYWFGEGVVPLLRARGLVADPAADPVGVAR